MTKDEIGKALQWWRNINQRPTSMILGFTEDYYNEVKIALQVAEYLMSFDPTVVERLNKQAAQMTPGIPNTPELLLISTLSAQTTILQVAMEHLHETIDPADYHEEMGT